MVLRFTIAAYLCGQNRYLHRRVQCLAVVCRVGLQRVRCYCLHFHRHRPSHRRLLHLRRRRRHLFLLRLHPRYHPHHRHYQRRRCHLHRRHHRCRQLRRRRQLLAVRIRSRFRQLRLRHLCHQLLHLVACRHSRFRLYRLHRHRCRRVLLSGCQNHRRGHPWVGRRRRRGRHGHLHPRLVLRVILLLHRLLNQHSPAMM